MRTLIWGTRTTVLRRPQLVAVIGRCSRDSATRKRRLNVLAVHGAFQRGRGGRGGWWILDEPELQLDPKEPVVPDLAGWRIDRMPELPETAVLEKTIAHEVLHRANVRTPGWVYSSSTPAFPFFPSIADVHSKRVLTFNLRQVLDNLNGKQVEEEQ